MKKAFIKMTLNVPDNFQVGDCKNCPLKGESYYDNHYVQVSTFCNLGLPSNLCPIEMEILP